MPGISQRIPMYFPDSEKQYDPCTTCQTLDCYSIHGPVDQAKCSLTSCADCADLARIDDQISTTYKRLSDLVQERKKIVTKSRHFATLDSIPVEILSSIFVSVKETIFNIRSKEHPEHPVTEPQYHQPSQSPPLLVGSVCQKWRDISLTTPQLWTDIIINLDKYAPGQFDMVKKWVHRSGSLPLDITMFISHGDSNSGYYGWGYQHRLLFELLVSLALRWNDIALYAPRIFCYRFLDSVAEAHINALFLSHAESQNSPLFELKHSLQPKSLATSFFYPVFTWDCLVFLNTSGISCRGLLQVIHDAQNLEYCIARGDCNDDGDSNSDDGDSNDDDPDFIRPVTSLSLTYLQTLEIDIIQHLVLPSLLYLEHDLLTSNLEDDIDTIIEFIDRSHCPPMDDLVLRGNIMEYEPFPHFEKLPCITSLFLSLETDYFLLVLTQPTLDPILPRLKVLSFRISNCSPSFWRLFRRLFPQVGHNYPREPKTIFQRPLSDVSVCIADGNDEAMAMDRDTFLHLTQVKNSGVKLVLLEDSSREDLFSRLANVFEVDL